MAESRLEILRELLLDHRKQMCLGTGRLVVPHPHRKCVMKMTLPDDIVGNAEEAEMSACEQHVLESPPVPIIVEHPLSTQFFQLEEALRFSLEIAVCVKMCHKDSIHRK